MHILMGPRGTLYAASMRLDPRYIQGIEYFNEQRYFEAHEVWEDLWRSCPPEPRRFYQGLIQLAVALYHHERGNFTSADRQQSRSRTKFADYPSHYLGLDWPALSDAVKAVIDHARTTWPEIHLSDPENRRDDG